MGIPVFEPYQFTEHKRLKAKMGGFEVQSFLIPHNSVENRGFLITTEGQTICFLIDLEYLPYNFQNIPINVLIVECNYIDDLVDGDIPNIRHKVLGHCELNTTIGIIQNCQKHLRQVFLTHASKGVTMDKERALKKIRECIPEYVQCEFVKENSIYDISEVPF